MANAPTAPQIRTTGQLREFLVSMMVGVKNGDLDLDKASRITKLAAQVNESMYAEMKVHRVLAEAGDTLPAMGSMAIGDAVEPSK